MNGNFYNNMSNDNYYQDKFGPYVDDIIKLNRGKKAKFHITVPGSSDFQDKVIEGIIEASSKDNIIVSNPNTGEWYLILLIYLDFITFEETIKYM